MHMCVYSHTHTCTYTYTEYTAYKTPPINKNINCLFPFLLKFFSLALKYDTDFKNLSAYIAILFLLMHFIKWCL